MQNLTPYLMFDGDCEAAIHFYQKVFDGEIAFMGRFGDGQMEDVPEEAKNLVMHTTFNFWAGSIMASDVMPGTPISPKGAGNRFNLSLGFDELEKLESTFKELKAGGEVTMELQDTFWGDRFGMIHDRFGVHWMLSCPIKQEEQQ